MWCLCPSGFEISWADGVHPPYFKSRGCLEITAATACQRFVDAIDGRHALQNVRRTLAAANPWLDQDDRRAAVQALEAAYTPLPTPMLVAPDQTGEANSTPKMPKLTSRRQLMLVELLALEAVGSTHKTTRDVVARRISKKLHGSDIGRDFASLERLGLTDSETGSDGGVWLTASGVTQANEKKEVK